MDSPRPEMPELEPAPDSHRRWQFSLRWMFVLMAVVATIAAVVRYAAGHPPLQVAIVCLSAFTVYLVLRAQSFLSHSLELRRIRENRRKLAAWAQWRRESKDSEESVE